ncbi:SH3-like domain-containing protein [Taibaiella soli]|uniref:Nitrile hydratase n=1 Tax=Taibaiella soli TaxID=1649169 RepID=A0A2W2B8T0_9BACT|nr:SH3-like domain-containing protein [Taibaiella soli]PZF72699.1 nitrile hydratase [Taibaiella soli]
MVQTVEHNPARFNEGDHVQVTIKSPIGHYRVPTYIRGKRGTITKPLGRYINPEEEAFGKNAGNKLWYYMVSFVQKELWPDYTGAPEDVLEIEIFENWLESI